MVVASDDAGEAFNDLTREFDVRLHPPRSSDTKHGVGPRQSSHDLGVRGGRNSVLVPHRPTTRRRIELGVESRVRPTSSVHACHRATSGDRQHLGPEADTQIRTIRPHPLGHEGDLTPRPIGDVTGGHRTGRSERDQQIGRRNRGKVLAPESTDAAAARFEPFADVSEFVGHSTVRENGDVDHPTMIRDIPLPRPSVPSMSGLDVRVERATSRDLDVLIDLHREFCEADSHPFDAASARRAFAPLLADDSRGVVWLVHTTDRPESTEGYAVVTWGWSIEAGGAESIFDEMFVRRRGIGIGSRAMSLVIDEVRRLGLARIYLETESHNENGRRLYRRLGFVDEDSIWMNLDFRDDRPGDGRSQIG